MLCTFINMNNFPYLMSKVVNLMSIDLLRQQPRWKEALVSLREMMTSLVQQVLFCFLFVCFFLKQCYACSLNGRAIYSDSSHGTI